VPLDLRCATLRRREGLAADDDEQLAVPVYLVAADQAVHQQRFRKLFPPLFSAGR
jgi:hypothetical protein